ncbi:capsule biosynthesis protein [Clostridium polyendosporum]|uniref:Capsule biosynthesis protein n=1 Tax=Clostridium polyendosporum TaxID=69208 RepID=A0A919RZP5_9CLOT|nr:CapA family protein [Clostridium polyendosporum]GIM29182.1 capsule biosynthesis protein [Clostridium polyendosporum]
MYKKLILLILSLMIGVTLSGCFNDQGKKTKEGDQAVEAAKINSTEKLEEAKEVEEERVETINLSSVGDILIHNTVFWAAYDEKSKSYDFKPQFKYVKKYLEKSDLTIANLETTLGGAERAYSGYPTFNTPDEIVDALKDSGVDVLTASNNHRMDTGEAGFFRTVRVVREKGLEIVGVKASNDEKSYIIKDIKGIKVGIANFSYQDGKINGLRTVNGIPVPKNIDPLIDLIDFSNLDETYKKLENRVSEMKKDGAEVLVFSMHWGNEYQRTQSKEQQLVAKKLADLGVDVIFGGHPHVLEPMDFIHSDISGKDTFIIYSQGNFISSQRQSRYTEDGIIVNVAIKKNFKTGKIEITYSDYMPTWVKKSTVNGKLSYEIIPTEDVINGAIIAGLTSEEKQIIQESSADTKKLMEKYTTKCSVEPVLK